ncbi:MAG: hypothetical protein N2204_09180, partial [Anaerolineae bacterium]|nr:hypothetical protein [Anaerolineae bacterium]
MINASFNRTFAAGVLIVGLVILLAVSTISTAVLAEQPAAVIQTAQPEYNHWAYIPLIARAGPPAPTPTLTPTPTPTPT